MTSGTMPLEVLDRELARLEVSGVSADEYQRLAEVTVDHPIIRKLNDLDPFSDEYRGLAMELYRALSKRRDNYIPVRDEQSHMDVAIDPWQSLPPWGFRKTALIAEFFESWAQIFRLLEINEHGRVLEYGSGSGQLLLWLARAGLRVFGADIDAASLEVTRRQAEVFGVDVQLEQAQFGEGFTGERFDRIIFFESFHHAWDFDRLLTRLHDRLTPGGRLIFCGEPIVERPTAGIPFPWGPRLDALSIFCMRRWGWMELGFNHDFFIQSLQRTGWQSSLHRVSWCGRAWTYVVEPVQGGIIHLGRPLELGRFAAGWDAPEGTHRWTRGGEAFLTLPIIHSGSPIDVTVSVSNFLPVMKPLAVACGGREIFVTLAPGKTKLDIVLRNCRSETLELRCPGHKPVDVTAGSNDQRSLGVAVHEVRVSSARICAIL